MQIGQIIRALRQEKGWTQEALALEAEMTTSYVSRIERGERQLSTSRLEKLAAVLGTSVFRIYAVAEGRSPGPVIAEKTAEADYSDAGLKLRRLFRQLGDDERELLIDFAAMLVKRRKSVGKAEETAS